MKRILFVMLALAGFARPMHAQGYELPVFLGIGAIGGNAHHLFGSSCGDQDGSRVVGPEVWSGLKYDRVRLIARAGWAHHNRRSQSSCSGNFLDRRRTYETAQGETILADLRAQYTVLRVGTAEVATGIHIGMVTDLADPYYGGTLMVKYGIIGIGADYSQRRVKWVETENLGQFVADGTHGAGGLLVRVYLETRRK